MKIVPPILAAIACSAVLLPQVSMGQSPLPSPEDTPTPAELAVFMKMRSWRSVIPLPSRSFTAALYHFEDGKLSKPLVPSPRPQFETPEANLTIIAGHDNGFYKLFLSLGAGLSLTSTSSVQVFEAEVPTRLPEKLAVGDYVLFGVARKEWKEGDKPSIQTYQKGILLRVQEFKGDKGA